jgi:zinc protease
LAALLMSVASPYARDYPPDVPAPKPVTLPTPAVHILPNGLRVVAIERHSLPVVALRMVVKAGAEADPPELPGAAQFVAGLLDEGTTGRSAQEIAQAIDQVGGTIQTAAEWDSSFVELSVLTDHSDLAFDLVSDMIIRPAFAPAEVERGRKQTLSALELMHEDPAYLADAVFSRVELSGTPYGHPADGTPESIRRLSARDLRDFHARYYLPSNAILAVVGDISADDAFRLAEKFFGNWQGSAQSDPPARRSVPSPPVSSVSRDSSRRVVVIDMPDAVQTEIRIGNSGIPRDSPDYYALTVANQILGGPATNRLFKALRSQHGLTYGASSDLVCHETAGSWEAKTSTRTPETLKSVQLVLEQMKRLRDHPIADWELDATRSYLNGHMALEFETSQGIAAQVLDLLIHDLPLDYWNRFPERVRDLTAQDVWNTARGRLDPDRAVIVMVGNLAGFRKELKKLGPVRIIPVGRMDLASADLERR